MITKSIIENFTTASGLDVYVQGSTSDRVTISFDTADSSHVQTFNIVTAKALANRINKVISEMIEVKNGKA